ncbi:MAG: hypothetical protein HY920_00335 [Elusimicrobia bacterium]|nr:hypothetical protein [Elusimicrobiota bacterium]
MNKVMIEIDAKQIETAIERLDIPEKLRLVRKLERATREARWNGLTTRIRQRLKKYPLSDKQISCLVENK